MDDFEEGRHGWEASAQDAGVSLNGCPNGDIDVVIWNETLSGYRAAKKQMDLT